jgi:hypothetical protein
MPPTIRHAAQFAKVQDFFERPLRLKINVRLTIGEKVFGQCAIPKILAPP